MKGEIMAELNSKTVYKVLDDNSFISEIRTLLIELGDEELSKPDSEISFDFIEECTNALLMLDEENDNKDITNYEVMRRADELVKAALYLKDLYNDFYTEYLNGSLSEDTLLDFVDENKDKVDDIYDKFDKLP